MIFWTLRRRRFLSSAALILVLAAGVYLLYVLATGTLSSRGIGTGFSFLWQEAGFSIGERLPIPTLTGGASVVVACLMIAALTSFGVRAAVDFASRRQRLVLTISAGAFLAAAAVLVFLGYAGIGWVSYEPQNSYAFALLTGFANTIKVSFFGCIFATVIGIVVGIARLSSNWLVSRSAAVFVESLRNIPLLIQIFFWYFGVLRTLPPVRDSVDLFGVLALNNRGVYLPRPDMTATTAVFVAALAIGLMAFVVMRRSALRIKLGTGHMPRWSWLVPLLPLLPPAAVWFALGSPVEWSYAERRGFNYVGGMVTTPEFTAMLLGLSLYSASFIAEIVRSGIQGVDDGQRQAARALGVTEGRIMRLIIFPQALRVMFPPLITQYLSLIKDSSLGFAIAYPELVSINSIMINHTGQPIEILTITITIFMMMNLLVSLILNRFEQARAW